MQYYQPMVEVTGYDGSKYWTSASSRVVAGTTSAMYRPSKAGSYRFFVYSYSYIDGQEAPKRAYSWETDDFSAQYPSASGFVKQRITKKQIKKQSSKMPSKPVITLTPGDGKITVSWDQCKGAVSYEINRYDAAGNRMPEVIVPATKKSYAYVDKTAEPGVRYRYTVSAKGGDGNGMYTDAYAMAGGKTRDEIAAEQTQALIDELPTAAQVTRASDKEFKGYSERAFGVQDVYDSLTDDQKQLVSEKAAAKLDAVMNAVVARKYAALREPAEKLIAALPKAATIASAEGKALDKYAASVGAARTAYGKIVPAEAKRGINIDKLVAAEQAVAAARKVEADKQAASEVTQLISQLPATSQLTLDDRERVEATRLAYEQLSADQKAYLSKKTLSTLNAATARIDELVDATRISIAKGKVKLAKASFTYNGSPFKPDVTLVVRGKTLQRGLDYVVAYKNNAYAGKAKVVLTGIGDYKGKAHASFTVAKAANTLSAKAKGKKMKASALALSKNPLVIKKKNAFAVQGAKGKLKFQKKKGDRHITVAANGKITVAKNLQPGTYKLRVKVTAAGNRNYRSATKVVKLKLVVK